MEDKLFLTYNQQMKKLRNDKKIDCYGTTHKKILVRSGYFNIVNGYKTPFVSGSDSTGHHLYISGTSINQLHAVKKFDDNLRSFLLRYITQVEEEIRTLVGYKFDETNQRGIIPWYDINAYNPNATLQNKMHIISNAYDELSKNKQDYVRFYMDNHKQIPTWIMIKVVNFSTLIDIVKYSKKDVPHSICNLYGMLEEETGKQSVKLLIGSLHWLRTIRNACAHNERVYCISRSKSYKRDGRIIEKYFRLLRSSYRSDLDQRIFDLLIYFKYYLPNSEYKQFIHEFEELLLGLKGSIHPHAFEYVRGQTGIKNIDDLELLVSLPKDDIEYNKFDKEIEF